MPRLCVSHFSKSSITAATKVNAAVVKSPYKNAVEPNNVAAQIWWTKARMRWSETVIQKDQDDVELARMSDGQLLRRWRIRQNRLGVKINLAYDFGNGQPDE